MIQPCTTIENAAKSPKILIINGEPTSFELATNTHLSTHMDSVIWNTLASMGIGKQTALIIPLDKVQNITISDFDSILLLGELALQTLTKESSLFKWRGSLFELDGVPMVATYHPSILQRQYDLMMVIACDVGRVAQYALNKPKPAEWNFILQPSFDATVEVLDMLTNSHSPILSVDIETRRGIACIGIAWDELNAICIPLTSTRTIDKSYFSHEEELIIRNKLQVLLQKAEIIGQNFHFDAQYIAMYMGFRLDWSWDTMIMSHTISPLLRKSLDFLASLYVDNYIYWKDDGKLWDAKMPEAQLWRYNCIDCVYTFQIYRKLREVLVAKNLLPIYEQQREYGKHLLTMMLGGILVDVNAKQHLSVVVFEQVMNLAGRVNQLAGKPLNINSPKQMKEYFYGELKLKERKNRKTLTATVDEDALKSIRKSNPELTELIDTILAIRSLGKLHSTYLSMKLSSDGRARSGFKLSGTSTYRLSSSKDILDEGGNMQNIPKGDDASAILEKEAAKKAGKTIAILPNVRKLFIPDKGMTIFDTDLDRADLMVVVWEADDNVYRQAIAEGHDLHKMNASVLYAVEESSVTYQQRQMAKMFVHGTNYGGSARTMAINCGVTVHAAEIMQNRYFAEHPGIRAWQKRVELQLMSTKEISNRFGYRIRFYQRTEGLLPEALAWIPQSTVGILINKIWHKVAVAIPEIEWLVQVHDSLVGQFPTSMKADILKRIVDNSKITIPYEKPLVINTSIAVSEDSWGECEKVTII